MCGTLCGVKIGDGCMTPCLFYMFSLARREGGGAYYAHQITDCPPPRFSDLPAALGCMTACFFYMFSLVYACIALVFASCVCNYRAFFFNNVLVGGVIS